MTTRRRVKHLDKLAPSSSGKAACGGASLTHASAPAGSRMKTTLATFIAKDGLQPCWRCKKTSVYTGLGGTLP